MAPKPGKKSPKNTFASFTIMAYGLTIPKNEPIQKCEDTALIRYSTPLGMCILSFVADTKVIWRQFISRSTHIQTRKCNGIYNGCTK